MDTHVHGSAILYGVHIARKSQRGQGRAECRNDA